MTARDRAKRGKSLRRVTGTRAPRVTFRVYTEGVATEPEYIDALKRRADIAGGVAVSIVITGSGATPMRLVEDACDDKRRAPRDVDSYWCLFDVEFPEAHPYLDRAVKKARDNGVCLAISNPCFELWLLLHYEDCTAPLSTVEAVRRRSVADGSRDKHIDGAAYVARVDAAVARAVSLERKHRLDGTPFPADNPSSSMDEFVRAIMAASTTGAKP